MILLETLQTEAFAAVAAAKKGITRQLAFPTVDNMIKVAIGMRRSGKSYFLYQTINQLLEQGVQQDQILFINFEDDRLLPMTAREMGELIDSFYTLYPENHQRTCYLFLDEVQNIEDWHLVVRRCFDSKDVQIYITGSSAKLLSKEINTSLRGRSLAIEVLPFSFYEYLEAHQLDPAEKPFGKPTYDRMRQHLTQYFTTGGFPGVQYLPNNEWRETLQSYMDSVILKDIVERYRVSNVSLLNYLAKTLVNHTASILSVNKLHNDLKSQGFRANKDTLHNYISYLQDAFLSFSVSHYSESERIRQTKPKKFYTIDSGLMNAITLGQSKNYGRLLENLVYLDLRRQGKKVFYYHTQSGYEIDFLTIDPEGKRELLQVSWDMTDKSTADRENRALEQAQAELNLKGRIITAWDYLRNGA